MSVKKYKVKDKIKCIKEYIPFVLGEVYEIVYVGQKGITVKGKGFQDKGVLKANIPDYFESVIEAEEESEIEVIYSKPLKINIRDIKLLTDPRGEYILLQTYGHGGDEDGSYGVLLRDRRGQTKSNVDFQNNWSGIFSEKFPASKLRKEELQLIKAFVKSMPSTYSEEADTILRLARIIKSKKREAPTKKVIKFREDDIRLLSRGKDKQNIILQVLVEESKSGILLRDDGEAEDDINFAMNWSSTFRHPVSIEDLDEAEKLLIIKFANSLDDSCSKAKDIIMEILEKPVVACVLWAEPIRDDNGVYSEGEQGLIDIYKAFARTAYDKLGASTISSEKEYHTRDRVQTVPKAEVVMIAKKHLDNVIVEFKKKYGDEVGTDIITTLLAV